MHAALREFVTLAREVQRICDTDASWETKYEVVFSAALSKRMYAICRFDYYDPDTSYEEDVLAFCRAVNEKADELEKVLG